MGIFSEIPVHNQLDVLKKLDFKDFINFKQCSQETDNLTKTFRHRIPLKVARIYVHELQFSLEISYDRWNLEDISILDEPVRFNVSNFWVTGNLSDARLAFVEDIARKTHLKTDVLSVSKSNDEAIDSGIIDRLIELFQAKELNLYYYSSNVLQNLTTLEKLQAIRFFNGEVNSDFFKLETPIISLEYCNGVTPSDVNTFLKQWLEGKRKIREFHYASRNDHSIILDGLDATHLSLNRELGVFNPLLRRERQTLKDLYILRRTDGKKLFIAKHEWTESVRTSIGEFEDIKELLKLFQVQ